MFGPPGFGPPPPHGPFGPGFGPGFYGPPPPMYGGGFYGPRYGCHYRHYGCNVF